MWVGREAGEVGAAPAPVGLRDLQEGGRITCAYRSSSPPVMSPQSGRAKGAGDPEEEVTIHTQGRA